MVFIHYIMAAVFYTCVYRYVRVLGAFYLRLVGTPVDIYQYLEPLYNDYRKIKQRLTQGEPHHISLHSHIFFEGQRNLGSKYVLKEMLSTSLPF